MTTYRKALLEICAYRREYEDVYKIAQKALLEGDDVHDWECGCGHWNGSNLSVCAVCGRTP